MMSKQDEKRCSIEVGGSRELGKNEGGEKGNCWGHKVIELTKRSSACNGVIGVQFCLLVGANDRLIKAS